MAFTYKGYRLYVLINKRKGAHFFFSIQPPHGKGMMPAELPPWHIVRIDRMGGPSIVSMDLRCPNCNSYQIGRKFISNIWGTKGKRTDLICERCGTKVGEEPF